MPRPDVYIAVLVPPSARILAKLSNRHISFSEVREAVILTRAEARWDQDERGWRLLVKGRTYAGRRLKVVLYPVDEEDGVWALGTALTSS